MASRMHEGGHISHKKMINTVFEFQNVLILGEDIRSLTHWVIFAHSPKLPRTLNVWIVLGQRPRLVNKKIATRETR